jgi:hypothetical protein
MCAHLASAGTIFRDTFNDGDAEDGMPVTWSPILFEPPGIFDASSGDYVIETAGAGFQTAVSGVPAIVLTDTSIRTRVRLLKSTGVYDTLGVLARVERGGLQSYYGGIEPSGDLYINLTNNNKPDLGRATTDLQPLQEDVMLQLDVIGSSIKLWAWRPEEPMPSVPQISINDSDLIAGEPMVLVHQSSSPSARGVFRFVHVADVHIPESSTLLLGLLALCITGALRKWGV